MTPKPEGPAILSAAHADMLRGLTFDSLPSARDALQAIATGAARVVPAGGEPVAWTWKSAYDGRSEFSCEEMVDSTPLYLQPAPSSEVVEALIEKAADEFVQRITQSTKKADHE